jgi:gluconolactonase
MNTDGTLLPGRLLRRVGAPERVTKFPGVQIDDPRLVDVLSPDAALLCLYEGTLHGEGPVWQPARDRLLWSDVPNRRLLAWHPDGQVTVAIDGTHFINGNAIAAEGHLVHCEHGRRCISRSDGDGQPEPIITPFEGKRLNSPNDVTVAGDDAIWFTDPIVGLLMPSQGSLVEPELDHRSVYRFDPGRCELRRMADFEQPNGLAFSPDGRTLYVSDSSLSLDEIPGDQTGTLHQIEGFDVGEDGNLTNRRFFCHTITATRTASPWTRAAGYGRRPPTASISWPLTARGSATFRCLRSVPTARSVATACAACSSPPPTCCWRSTWPARPSSRIRPLKMRFSCWSARVSI